MQSWFRSRHRTGLCILAILLGNMAHAFGDPAHDQTAREAKQLRDQGAAAVRAHDFPAALDAFERAYALYPTVNLLFNIGVALDGLQRVDDAVAAFEEFLASASAPPPVARDYARNRLRELEPRVARVTLAVRPPDAAVSVDGRPVHMPMKRPLPLLPGEHVVVATRSSHVAASERFTVAAGDYRHYELVLPRERTVSEPTSPEVRDPPPITRAPAPPLPSLVTPPDLAAQRRWRRTRLTAVGVGSFGIASLVAGAGMAALTASLDRQLNDPRVGTMFDPSLINRGQTAQALEVTFLTLGGVATMTGLTLYLVAQRHEHHVR